MDGTGVRSADIVILAGLVGVVVLLLVTMAVHRKHLEAQQAGNKRGGTRSPVLSLPPGIRLGTVEEMVLSRLGWLFRNPNQRFKLLTDREMFLKAARRALKEGFATERELLGLARAAGLSIDKIDPTAMSTLKLPSGVEVSVADHAMKSGAGALVTNHPDALRIRLKMGHTSFNPGTRLDVVCNSSRGLYRFSSIVTGSNGKVLDLKHTDQIEAVQRRKHQRHGVQVPVELKSSDGVVGSSRTNDLSIGGAAVKNPSRAFQIGNRITLAIGTDGSRVKVPATVVRTSRNGRVLHIQFDRPTEATRHRLFQTIMTASTDRKRRG